MLFLCSCEINCSDKLYCCSATAYFSAAVNSGVHVFMYFYYLVSALLRNNERARRKYLFWGR